MSYNLKDKNIIITGGSSGIGESIIDLLLKNKAKIIILSHIGRPKGKVINELSLKPVCNELEKKFSLHL